MVYCKDVATNLNNDIKNTNNFQSFMYKTKLFQGTETDGRNESYGTQAEICH